MSISGKSDFSDIVEMHYSPQEILNNFKVYASGNDIVPLKMGTKKDLVAYYPYLVATMTCDKKSGGHIYLSGRSFIDQEEAEMMERKLTALKEYRKKCKRDEVPFDNDEAIKLISFFEPYMDYEKELVKRVEKYGGKATIEGIHDPLHEKMRKEWYDLMVENGWEKWTAYRWVYGWNRWLEESKNDNNN